MTRFCNKISRTKLLALPLALLMVIANACTIEPPLKLPEGVSELWWPEVAVDINVVWNIDADWQKDWWYGWDQGDIDRWGIIDYPPTYSHQVRLYYYGENPDQPRAQRVEKFIADGNSFRRRFDYGYHDLLIWSDIYTSTHTQAVTFNEADDHNITASTTRTTLPYIGSNIPVHNDPEVFYSGIERKFYLSDNPDDYDYFDESRGIYVKELHTQIYPLVYIYLVQVVIYNNHGRVRGTSNYSAINSLADGVTLHTGHTSNNEVFVIFPQRMKLNIPARNGVKADIIGGKLLTYGLCDMGSWASTRSRQYSGSRGDLRNHLHVNMHFYESTDTTYTFDVTDQMQRQAHGGVITIEIDADTLKLPQKGSSQGGTGFDPVIGEWGDSVVHEYPMHNNRLLTMPSARKSTRKPISILKTNLL